jgi:hypothetical protein
MQFIEAIKKASGSRRDLLAFVVLAGTTYLYLSGRLPVEQWALVNAPLLAAWNVSHAVEKATAAKTLVGALLGPGTEIKAEHGSTIKVEGPQP